jgi:RNA polymerase subunit RPABC4/transcription elongation factor Spt4
LRMTESGTDRYGAEYKRTSNDFHFRLLEQDNCVCSICHGTGAKVEFRYVTRDYESARRKGKICKTLQAHEHSFWICPVCVENLVKKSRGLVKVLVKVSSTGAEGSDEVQDADSD